MTAAFAEPHARGGDAAPTYDAMYDDPAPEAALALAIGSQLKAARERDGLSRCELARRIGVSDVSLINVEFGRANLTLKRLTRLADAYGVEVEVRARRRPRARS